MSAPSRCSERVLDYLAVLVEAKKKKSPLRTQMYSFHICLDLAVKYFNAWSVKRQKKKHLTLTLFYTFNDVH